MCSRLFVLNPWLIFQIKHTELMIMGLMVAEPVILLFEGMRGAPDQFQLVSTHTYARHFFLSSIGVFFGASRRH